MKKFDEKIKLNQFHNFQKFIKAGSLFNKFIETLFYIIISNTDTIIYLSMMFSMYQSAGIISLIYPISIFGYALIEEARPNNKYWFYVQIYASIILALKFITNLTVLSDYFANREFVYWSGYLKLGISEMKSGKVTDILKYLSPEILIISFVMLNQIHLKLLGVFDEIEEEQESIKDAFQRYVSKGDMDHVAEEKKKRTYMYLEDFFAPYEDQKDALILEEHEKKL